MLLRGEGEQEDTAGTWHRLDTMPIQQDVYEQCAMFPTSRHSAAMQSYNLATPAAFSYNPNSASPSVGQQTPGYAGQEYGQFQITENNMMQQSGGTWPSMYSAAARAGGGGGGGMTGAGHLDDAWSGYVSQSPGTVQNHYASYRGTLSSTGGSPMPSDYIPNTQAPSSSIMTLTGNSTPGAATQAMTANNAAAARQSRPPYDWMKKQSYPTTPSAGKTRTKDKYRVVYSDHQRLELEKEFHYSRYITIRRKAELAQNLQLSERQVKIWFQNRRAKERKQNKKKGDMSAIIKTDLSAHMHGSPELSPNQI